MRSPTKVELGLALIIAAGSSYAGYVKWHAPRLRYLSDFAQKYDAKHRDQNGFVQLSGTCVTPVMTPFGPKSVAYVTILLDVDTKTGRLYVTKVEKAPDSFQCP